VIGTEEGGVTELIEINKTGWLISPENPQQLAEAIVAVERQPEESHLIAQQARIHASERFNIKVINQQISQLLTQAIDNQ
jgi:glycosyltransferase involved in cell wall biosynthesis